MIGHNKNSKIKRNPLQVQKLQPVYIIIIPSLESQTM